uniref:Uncharacterized protein n=1 Tax=Melanopsichium pennsylvanicum 4 TaxID=1398559 RepID=A0A077R5N8_9BASI|nr:uncharacterized protein BN887_06161 [Melanopsichium pennsylvanicum 4]
MADLTEWQGITANLVAGRHEAIQNPLRAAAAAARYARSGDCISCIEARQSRTKNQHAKQHLAHGYSPTSLPKLYPFLISARPTMLDLVTSERESSELRRDSQAKWDPDECAYSPATAKQSKAGGLRTQDAKHFSKCNDPYSPCPSRSLPRKQHVSPCERCEGRAALAMLDPRMDPRSGRHLQVKKKSLSL